MIFNYQIICQDLLKDLTPRAREILVRRFGLETGQRETLQAVGQDYNITRERVRQIERAGITRVRGRTKRHEPVFDFFTNQLKSSGNLRREDVLLRLLSPEELSPQVFFLLSLKGDFERFLETNDFYTLWTIDRESLVLAEKTSKKVVEKIKKIGKPLTTEEIVYLDEIEAPVLFSFLEASKQIWQGPQGLWGLRVWPEINPRGTRDKAYLILKKEAKPLHFREVAHLINQEGVFESARKAHPQTVHNELIKDPRFILVGRGTYALAEWGYEPGTVKEVIIRTLKNQPKGLTQEEIVDRVLGKRQVKKNTILLNLRDGKLFTKTAKGKYTLA